MPTYAVLQDNEVTNVIVAETLEDAMEVTGLTCVETTPENPTNIGYKYNGTTFEEPVVEELP
jgi:hypothetical protein